MFEQLNLFLKNPAAFLASRQLNIPAKYMTDPNTAINYLMTNNKLSQEQYGQAMQELTKCQAQGQMPDPSMYFGSSNPR